jgi:hypothetical protein
MVLEHVVVNVKEKSITRIPLTQPEIDDFNRREQEHAAKAPQRLEAEIMFQRKSDLMWPKESEMIEALELAVEGNMEPLTQLKARKAEVEARFPLNADIGAPT